MSWERQPPPGRWARTPHSAHFQPAARQWGRRRDAAPRAVRPYCLPPLQNVWVHGGGAREQGEVPLTSAEAGKLTPVHQPPFTPAMSYHQTSTLSTLLLIHTWHPPDGCVIRGKDRGASVCTPNACATSRTTARDATSSSPDLTSVEGVKHSVIGMCRG